MQKKILLTLGTRPEAIKMIPIIKELEQHSDKYQLVVVSSGQHKEMLEPLLEKFNIHVDYDLGVMKKGQGLSELTSAIMTGIESIMKKADFDLVLVHGDTTTAFAACLAAFYNKIKIGHVEAGLRTGDMSLPFPEEMNRVFIDSVADICFAPTEHSKQNLLAEKIQSSKIHVTGNTAIDTLKLTVGQGIESKYLQQLDDKQKLIVLTMHRRENIGDAMRETFSAIKRIIVENEDIMVIYPVHMNPIIRELAQKYFENESRVILTEPLEIDEFHSILAKSYLVLTDSGGIQEEAVEIGIPTFVLRDSTERPEGVAAGGLKLIGTQEAEVYRNIQNILQNKKYYQEMQQAGSVYGDGSASQKIVQKISDFFKLS